MVTVLFDTNIVLDIALRRMPYFKEAGQLFQLIDTSKIIGYVTASSITDIYYIAKKEKGHTDALAFVSDLITVLEVIGVDKDTIVEALRMNLKDFEDAVQVAAATSLAVKCVVTRNTKDFASASLEVHNPTSFLEKYAQW